MAFTGVTQGGGGAAVGCIRVAPNTGLITPVPPSSAAGLVQFFASMMYVRWLGPRIPDRSITEKAAEYMWLLPLIYVLGACIVIGPFVAVIMYYVLLNKVRVKVSEIRARQRLETTAMESPVRIS